MKPDYGIAMTLGEDKMPVPDKSVDIILANYVLMFLNYREFNQVMDEIKRIAAPGAYLMYELYAAKDSHCKDKQQLFSLLSLHGAPFPLQLRVTIVILPMPAGGVRLRWLALRVG